MNIPKKAGQIVRFHAPLDGENPNQQYVVLELHGEEGNSRAKIKALNTGLPFAPITVVRISDLETVDSNTSDLIGYVAYVKKADSSEVLGRVTSVHSEKISLDLSIKDNGVDTNVYVTVVDNEGNEHSGALFVK